MLRLEVTRDKSKRYEVNRGKVIIRWNRVIKLKVWVGEAGIGKYNREGELVELKKKG
jgi:hypothetical protein